MNYGTLKWCSHFPFLSSDLVNDSISQGPLVRTHRENVPALNSKSSQRKKSTKAVICFCSFTYCKVMVVTKENCGEGVETCVGLERWVAPEEKAEKKSFRFSSGVSSVLGQWWERRVRGDGGGGGGGGVRERDKGQRFKLFPPRRSSHWGVHFGTAVSVSPTGTERWRNPQSLCPSRWGAEGRVPRPRRSPGGLRVASGRRSHWASLLQEDTTHSG